MKKFLVLAFAGVVALSVTACGAKEDVKEVVQEVKEEIEEEAEEKAEEIGEDASAFYVEHGEISLNLPEGWFTEEASDPTMIKISNEKRSGILFVSWDEGEAEEDFRLFGLGKGSVKNGTEAENIEPFESGNFTWRGYSFVYPAIWTDEHIVNLVSETDENGKYVEVQVWLGENGAEDFAIDDDNVGYIIESIDFVD